MAISFYEVCKVLGPRAIVLTEPFVAMMYDFIDVSQHLIKASEKTLQLLCVDVDAGVWEEPPPAGEKKKRDPRMPRILIDTILLFESHLIFRWRLPPA